MKNLAYKALSNTYVLIGVILIGLGYAVSLEYTFVNDIGSLYSLLYLGMCLASSLYIFELFKTFWGQETLRDVLKYKSSIISISIPCVVSSYAFIKHNNVNEVINVLQLVFMNIPILLLGVLIVMYIIKCFSFSKLKH